MTESEEWEQVPADPDPVRDLQYELAELDVLEPTEGTDQLLFLPKDEDVLKENAFIVATSESVCNVIDWL